MLRIALSLFALIALAGSAAAQITLTGADFFSQIGDSYQTHASPDGVTVTVIGAIGTPGPNDWDFTTFGNVLTRDLTYDYVETTDGGFGGETIFPGAAYGQRLTTDSSGSVTGYLYGTQEAGGRRIHGSYFPGVVPQPEQVFMPPAIDYPSTINFGDTWSVSTVVELTLDVLGTPTATRNTYLTQATCDGWGTVTLPDLGVVNGLRIQEFTTVDVAVDLFGTGSFSTIDTVNFRSYAWFAEGMDEVARLTSQQFSTTVPPSGVAPTNFTEASFFQVQYANSGATVPPAMDPLGDEFVGAIDAPYSRTVTATGTPSPVFTLASAPAGMTIGLQSGVIDWTPTAGDLGEHLITVDATNGSGTASESYTLTVANVDDPPQNLTTDFVSAGTVALTWDPPVVDLLLTGYEVRRAETPGGSYSVIGTTGSAVTTFEDSSAATGSGHYYVVAAILDTGSTTVTSDASNEAFSYLLLPSESILSYGDESPEAGLVVAGLNSEMAVSFTLPASGDVTLTKVAVFIEDYVGATLTLKAYAADAGVQPGSSLVQLAYLGGDVGPGWNVLEILPDFLQPSFTGGESFFVGVVEGDTNNAIGVDESVFGHSWTRASGGAWSFLSSGDIMIRAIVDGDPVVGGPTFVRGDSNADGGFNIGDAVYALDFLFSGGPEVCRAAMDANDDNGVDVGDVVYMLEALFSGGSLPPSPHPGCGVDPDAGPLPCDSFPAC
ncbi:MAG: putative Ig domain-containing protein [Planctomycetota bacterium]